MRVCLVYDCLYPYTVGGAERWYRNLAERLAAEGHEVTYLTLRQWDGGERVELAGVDVRAVGPRMALYVDGRRRILPPLVFGAGVLWHLLRRGGRYDAVHTASFPYFSLLGAGLLRPLWRYRLVVDWHEVWTREYWREYLGAVAGAIGYFVQARCVRLRQRAFCFSRLHARRLVAEGLRGEPTVLEGEYVGSEDAVVVAPVLADREPVVVFAGRMIPEKRAGAVVPAITLASRAIPGLRGEIYGAGPEHADVVAAIADQGLAATVSAPGFVSSERIDAALAQALCMVLPSRREGYGLIVIEAAARGTPSVVVEGPDNAATELVEDGLNGFISPSAGPEDLAAAIVRVHQAGAELRQSTAGWFAANSSRLSLESSLAAVVESYQDAGYELNARS
jgi:glycosyltransferase involved in cell wall biosynthesis